MKLIFITILLLSQSVPAQVIPDWKVIAISPKGAEFTFVSAENFLVVDTHKQDNGWSYAIWEDLVEMNVYAQDTKGIWWTVARTDWDSFKPECLSEPGDIDKIRMSLDDIVSGKLPNCLLEYY